MDARYEVTIHCKSPEGNIKCAVITVMLLFVCIVFEIKRSVRPRGFPVVSTQRFTTALTMCKFSNVCMPCTVQRVFGYLI